MNEQETDVQPFDRPSPPVAVVATATPVFWDLDPRQLVELVARSVERVLSHLTEAAREIVRDELEAWRAWSAGRLSDGRLRLSAQVVREALEGGRHDLAAASVAVAAQTVDTAALAASAETPERRRALLWSARMSAERAVHAADLARRSR